MSASDAYSAFAGLPGHALCRQMRPHKSKPWRIDRYWGQSNPERGDRWVFGDKCPNKHGLFHYLLKNSWFKIVRHKLVKGTSSPDDAILREYWRARQMVNIRHLSASDVDLATNQDWDCSVCGEGLINGELLERHPIIARACRVVGLKVSYLALPIRGRTSSPQ
jgi:RNA-directed DNA polymerase